MRAPIEYPRIVAALVTAMTVQAGAASAQTTDSTPKPRITVYGWAQADMGYDFGQIDPTYVDRLRVSALPSVKDQFGRNGQTYFSVRQTRFGLTAYYPTDLGEIFTIIEFDLMGSGADAGKTTPRLRHAYGELGRFGAGQYWSPFIDVESYPTIVESFGPTGLPWLRNIQLRWTPVKSATQVTLAIEKPGASGEGGDYSAEIELQNVQIRFRTPEWVAAVRHDWKWGHLQASGLFRKIWWDDLTNDAIDLGGNATGWGFNFTSAVKFGKKDAVRLQFLVGEGVENYLNDGTADVAPKPNPGNPSRPIIGEALPVRSFTGYVEMYRGKWAGIAGFSTQDIDNATGQSPNAFAGGDYATVTIIYYPITNVLVAGEYQYGRRRNFSDGFKYSDNRLQLTLRYSLSMDIRAQ